MNVEKDIATNHFWLDGLNYQFLFQNQ